MTLEEAKNLTHGQTIFATHYKNADGTPTRWRVVGRVKTWKTMPERVRVPLKHGLYQYGALDETCLDAFTLSEL